MDSGFGEAWPHLSLEEATRRRKRQQVLGNFRWHSSPAIMWWPEALWRSCVTMEGSESITIRGSNVLRLAQALPAEALAPAGFLRIVSRASATGAYQRRAPGQRQPSTATMVPFHMTAKKLPRRGYTGSLQRTCFCSALAGCLSMINTLNFQDRLFLGSAPIAYCLGL